MIDPILIIEFVILWIAIPGIIVFFLIRRRRGIMDRLRMGVGFAHETFLDLTQTAPQLKITIPHQIKPKMTVEEKKIEKSKDLMNDGSLELDSDFKMFADSYDTSYKRGINTSALEVTHSNQAHMKQLDIQMLKEQRKIKMSGS